MRISKRNKILHHPDREEIVKRLSEGESVRSVHSWLNYKYAKFSKHNKVSIPTLQAFRKEVMGMEGKALRDVQDARKREEAELEKQYAEQAVVSTNAYKDKINAIAGQHLDVSTKILQMDAIVADRMEYWFNLLKQGDEAPSHKVDYELRKYIDQQMAILQQYKKLVEGMADKRVDYNVNITVMNDQLKALQAVIRDLICEELGPEKAIEFMGKLTDRLEGLDRAKQLPEKVTNVTFEDN
jgi:hypothetical protein